MGKNYEEAIAALQKLLRFFSSLQFKGVCVCILLLKHIDDTCMIYCMNLVNYKKLNPIGLNVAVRRMTWKLLQLRKWSRLLLSWQPPTPAASPLIPWRESKPASFNSRKRNMSMHHLLLSLIYSKSLGRPSLLFWSQCLFSNNSQHKPSTIWWTCQRSSSQGMDNFPKKCILSIRVIHV